MLTISSSARNWATVRWHECDDGHLLGAINALSMMPGVKAFLDARMLEVPASVWATDWWRSWVVPFCATWREPTGGAALWSPARALFPHQQVGVDFLVAAGGGLCADQMGLGKTTVAIVTAERIARAEAPDSARLIIAPGFTRDVWRRELLALGAITHADQFCAVRTRNPLDASFTPKASPWWFVHYDVAEAWASRLVTNARGRPIVAIVDEAHWIKNGRAQRSKGVAASAGCASSRILLTGTPIANRPQELWHLLTVLDGPRSWGSPVEFRQRYCGAFNDGYGWQDGILPTNTDELQERLTRRYLRRTVDDTGLALPALSRQVLEAEMGDSDRAEHVEILGDAGGMAQVLSALDRGAYGQDVLRALARLSKLTSAAKLRTTSTFLDGLVEQGEAAVVFCHERATARKLGLLVGVAEGTDEPRAWVATGEDSQDERDEVVRRFQGGERDFLITTYGAMREGVTLDRARMVVLHDLSWVPSAVLQAEARVHRLTQRRGCVSTWVMVKDSFDTILARTLEAKGATIAAALGDTSASRAASEVGLENFTGSSVEAEARRLLNAWASHDVAV